MRKKRDAPLKTSWEKYFHMLKSPHSARVSKVLPLPPSEEPVDALSKLRQELPAPEHKFPNRH